MKDLFDMNLSIENIQFGDGIKTYSVHEEPFGIFGTYDKHQNVFCRMPSEAAEKVSAGVVDRAERCAGVRLRFKTDSKKLGIRATFKKTLQFPTQTSISARGFDVYIDNAFVVSAFPQDNNAMSYETIVDLKDNCMKNIDIYFPYNAVINSLHLGLDNIAKIEKASEYKINKPMVFYGSSITHGFCVSRPGNAFSAIVSRKMNADFVNLGFSGVCHGELQMADYLASIKKSVLICEFDHNEATAFDLAQKHLPFYKRIREADSQTPIVFMSSPNRFYNGNSMHERMKIVEETVEYARTRGDSNTFFINGQNLYPENDAFDCTIDGIHPNDYGAFMIAQKIYDVLHGIELN